MISIALFMPKSKTSSKPLSEYSLEFILFRVSVYASFCLTILMLNAEDAAV